MKIMVDLSRAVRGRGSSMTILVKCLRADLETPVHIRGTQGVQSKRRKELGGANSPKSRVHLALED